MNDIATLGNDAGFSVFFFGNRIIRFKAPYSLERYTYLQVVFPHKVKNI